MSRFEGDFSVSGEAALSASELLDVLQAGGTPAGRQRQAAIACYLSASEGWDQALKDLRGAFASDAAAAVRSVGAQQVTPNDRDINQRASEYLQWPALKPAGNDNV